MDAEAIKSLVANKVSESQRLEYKREYPPKFSDGEKKEFLADVSAVANTAGGHILYGIDEERDVAGQPTGIPTSIAGVPVPNEDALRRAWEQMISTGLNPPLRGVAVKAIEVDGMQVVALTIPRSLHAPHAVWFERNGKFWKRSSSGKYQVETAELRAMFLERDAWEAEAERYHKERTSLIQSGVVLPSAGDAPGTIILHLLPLGRLRDMTVHVNNSLASGLMLLWNHERGGGFDCEPTMEGFIVHSGSDLWTLGFIHLLRFGGLEICIGNSRSNRKFLSVDRAVPIVRSYVESSAKYLQDTLNISPPFALAVTVTNIEGSLPAYHDKHGFHNVAPRKYLRKQLNFPLLAINEEGDVARAVKALCDMLWHSGGFNPQN
jgi:hypothetical protein